MKFSKYLFFLLIPWILLFSFNAVYVQVHGKRLWKKAKTSCTYACSGYPTKTPKELASRIMSGGKINIKTGYCRHQKYSLLPAFITADRGLYGMTIKALFSSGGSSTIGYGVVNLLFFCMIWPGLMAGMLVLVLWQRKELKRRRGK